MTDQTREIIRQRRAQLSYEERCLGWDYDYWIENNCIYGAFFRPDGTVEDIELLQVLKH